MRYLEGLSKSVLGLCLIGAVALSTAWGSGHRALRSSHVHFKFHGEELGKEIDGHRFNVRYIRDRVERERYALEFRDGIIYQNGEPFDTSRAENDQSPGFAIFVLGLDGRFYASSFSKKGIFHHSSFFAGEAVATAGEIRVVNGVLEIFTDRSGHQFQYLGHVQQALELLAESGITPKSKVLLSEIEPEPLIAADF